jgi:hypothetical protein
MKRAILLTLLITFFSIQNYSQQENKLFYFGAGIGFGFFNPEDINSIIEYNYGSASTEMGFYEMILYFVINAKGSFFFTKHTELQIGLEGAFGPKLITDANSSETDFYSFNRFTPSLKFNFHIPAGKKLSIYFGPGVNWSAMKFKNEHGEDLKNNTIGFSGQAGVMVRFSKWAIAPFLDVNFINAKDTEVNGVNTDLELNYTGVTIGNTFYF